MPRPDHNSTPMVPAYDLVFVTGPHASGKSAVAHTLEDCFDLIDMGPELKALHALEAPDDSFETWIGRHEERDPYFTSSVVGRVIANHQSTLPDYCGTCVIGPRSMGAINAIAGIAEANSTGLVYVTAPFDVLEERYKNRTEYALTAPFEAAYAYDGRLGTYEIEDHADLIIINDGPLETARAALRSFVMHNEVQPANPARARSVG